MRGELKLKRTTLVVAAALLAITIAGCAPAAPQAARAPMVVEVEREAVREIPVEKALRAPVPAVGGSAGFDEAATLASVSERMIIRTVELAMYTEDVQASLVEIQSLAKEMGGYVSSANTWHQGEYLRARLTIRIPAKDLESGLKRIRALATEVERESTSGEDVTEEYTDLEARLRNLEATEVELRELLATVRQRTGKAEDILAVHRELTIIRGQIEQIKGRMQFLEQMSALATIHVELTPDVLSRPLSIGRWEPKGTAANAVRTLIQLGQFVVDAAIVLVILGLPILVAIAVTIYILSLIIRFWRRRRRARQARES